MALQPAVLGTARLNNFRLNYLSAQLRAIRATRVRIWLDGELATSRVRLSGLSIRDVLNDEPNTCDLKIEGSPPPVAGMALRITINSDTPQLLFAGAIQVEGETFEGTPAHVVYPCRGIDDHGAINKLRPFGIWSNTSASTIAAELLAQFAPGFTGTHIQPGLAAVTFACDGTDTLTSALRRLVKMIGGYFYVEDKDLHLFLDEVTEVPDPLDHTPKRFLHAPPIAWSSDDSQIRTRVYGRGHAATILVDLAAGATQIPIDDVVMFNASGGRAICSTTPDGAATERLTYTGTGGGGGGAIAGPGARPSVALSAAPVAGSGLGLGTYQYAYTVLTAAGQSLPSPLTTVVTLGPPTTPTTLPQCTTAPRYAAASGSFSPIGETHQYVYAYSTKTSYVDYTSLTAASPPSAVITTISNQDPYNPAQSAPVLITVPFSTDPRHKVIFLYQKASSIAGGQFRLLLAADNQPTYPPGSAYTFTTQGSVSSNSATLAPGTTTAPSSRAIAITGVPLGPSGTTARQVYRTAVNASQLKLLYAIFDNTSSGATTDAIADGSLGANVPTSDTSGLTQPDGQINAGESSILLTSTAPFAAPAGWARTLSGDAISYSGISGNTLTGIPASGPGAIRTTIMYGDPIVPAPVLTGVSGNTKALTRGAPLYIWVQRDDTAAQAAAAARESTDTYTSSGIHEHTLVDERRGEPSLMALCDADLQLFAYPLVTVTYATRDLKTRSGKPIVIDLTSPAIHETLTIQDVTITEIDIAPGLAPRFSVSASSVRWSLEDLLRRLSGLVEV